MSSANRPTPPKDRVATLRVKCSDGIIRAVTTYPWMRKKNGRQMIVPGMLIHDRWRGWLRT